MSRARDQLASQRPAPMLGSCAVGGAWLAVLGVKWLAGFSPHRKSNRVERRAVDIAKAVSPSLRSGVRALSRLCGAVPVWCKIVSWCC